QYVSLVRRRVARQSLGFSRFQRRTSAMMRFITLFGSTAAAPASRILLMSLVRKAVAIIAAVIWVGCTRSPAAPTWGLWRPNAGRGLWHAGRDQTPAFRNELA